jgi:hypothetical protein
MPTALIKQSARFVSSSPAAGAVPVAATVLAQGVIQMMWLARLKLLAAVGAALILATAGVAVLGRQQPAPEGAREQAKTAPGATAGAGGTAAAPDLAADRALARQQLALIDQAWTLMHDLAQTTRLEISTAPFGVWGRRRLEALHRAGAEKAEIVAALEKYIDSLKELEAFAKDKNQQAQATRLGVYETQFLRMEAEIWLKEEKAR